MGASSKRCKPMPLCANRRASELTLIKRLMGRQPTTAQGLQGPNLNPTLWRQPTTAQGLQGPNPNPYGGNLLPRGCRSSGKPFGSNDCTNSAQTARYNKHTGCEVARACVAWGLGRGGRLGVSVYKNGRWHAPESRQSRDGHTVGILSISAWPHVCLLRASSYTHPSLHLSIQ